MRDPLKIALGIILGFLGIAICLSCACILLGFGGLSLLGPSLDTPFNTTFATSTPSLFEQIYDGVDTLSPSYAWGKPVRIGTLETLPLQQELVYEYSLENNELVTPPPSAAFLWIFIRVSNVGDNAETTDFIFKLYYSGKLLDSATFGYYEPINRPSFSFEKIYPSKTNEGWILFEVPEGIDLSKTYFLALPLSSYNQYTAWKLTD